MRLPQILIILAAAIGSAWLTTFMDDGFGLEWSHTAVRNWEQYGLFTLHGKMVVNPGGFEADTNPETYQGHRPTSLFPVFACHHLLTALGLGNWGFVTYYALVAGMAAFSVWWMLGKTERAFTLAVIAVVTPGFVRWQTSLDPNLAAVLFGFPFCAAAITLLQRPSLKWPRVVMLLGLILAYSALNWTTVFIHAMLFVTLLALARVSLRHLAIYAGLTAMVTSWVLISSVASKMGHAGGSGGGMWQNYGWGHTGYGIDMTTQTALTRLLVVNFLSLLPMLAYLGCQWWRCREWPTATPVRCLFPLLTMATEILGMRNYFGHHPWMSVHFVLLSIILAAVVWKNCQVPTVATGSAGFSSRFAWLAGTFVYSLVVLFLAEAYNGRGTAFAAFIEKQTARNTTIVIRSDTDAALADIAARVAVLVDRHVVVAHSATDAVISAIPAQWVILTTVPSAGRVVAESSLEQKVPTSLEVLLGWYSKFVARRRAGDKLEIPGEKIFLCEPQS